MLSSSITIELWQLLALLGVDLFIGCWIGILIMCALNIARKTGESNPKS